MHTLDIIRSSFSAANLKEIFLRKIRDSKAVGKDGMRANEYEKHVDLEIKNIRSRVFKRTYHFTAYRQKLILKGAGKYPREISVATVRDRLTLSALNNVLSRLFPEAKIRPPHFYISEIRDVIRGRGDEWSFVQIDVKDFYPSIEHDKLLKSIRRRTNSRIILDLVQKAVSTRTGESSFGLPNEVGIPQGLSISNILSSIYMAKFDDKATDYVTYYRYVDDILVICKTKDSVGVYERLREDLLGLGLTCHKLEDGSKTKIVGITRGVDYLGYHVRPGIISVRKSSFRKIMTSIISLITGAKRSASARRGVLFKVNLKITGCILNEGRLGWMFFFSMTDDLSQLKRLDRFVEAAWNEANLARLGRPKSFVKTYHEIRFRLDRTKYIPKFDDYDLSKKIDVISALSNFEVQDIVQWGVEEIDAKFKSLLQRQIVELEKDVTPHS